MKYTRMQKEGLGLFANTRQDETDARLGCWWIYGRWTPAGDFRIKLMHPGGLNV